MGKFLDKALLKPLIFLNLAIYLVILGIAGWAIDCMMDGVNIYGNGATYNFIIFCLIGGAAGLAAMIAGFHLLKHWSHESAGAAGSSALIAWLLILVAFGLACKEIDIGYTGTHLKVLEAFVIIVGVTHGFYLLVLHADYLGI